MQNMVLEVSKKSMRIKVSGQDSFGHQKTAQDTLNVQETSQTTPWESRGVPVTRWSCFPVTFAHTHTSDARERAQNRRVANLRCPRLQFSRPRPSEELPGRTRPITGTSLGGQTTLTLGDFSSQLTIPGSAKSERKSPKNSFSSPKQTCFPSKPSPP